MCLLHRRLRLKLSMSNFDPRNFGNIQFSLDRLVLPLHDRNRLKPIQCSLNTRVRGRRHLVGPKRLPNLPPKSNTHNIHPWSSPVQILENNLSNGSTLKHIFCNYIYRNYIYPFCHSRICRRSTNELVLVQIHIYQVH